MFLIKDYLKLKNITIPDGAVRESVSKVLKDTINVDIPQKKIQVRNRVVFIEGSGGVKANIFLKKKILLEELKKVLGEEKAPYDIR